MQPAIERGFSWVQPTIYRGLYSLMPLAPRWPAGSDRGPPRVLSLQAAVFPERVFGISGLPYGQTVPSGIRHSVP